MPDLFATWWTVVMFSCSLLLLSSVVSQARPKSSISLGCRASDGSETIKWWTSTHTTSYEPTTHTDRQGDAEAVKWGHKQATGSDPWQDCWSHLEVWDVKHVLLWFCLVLWEDQTHGFYLWLLIRMFSSSRHIFNSEQWLPKSQPSPPGGLRQ